MPNSINNDSLSQGSVSSLSKDDDLVSLLSQHSSEPSIWDKVRDFFASCSPFASSAESYRQFSSESDVTEDFTPTRSSDSEKVVGALSFTPLPPAQKPLYLRIWEAVRRCFTSCGSNPPVQKNTLSTDTPVLKSQTLTEMLNELDAAALILNQYGENAFQKNPELKKEFYVWLGNDLTLEKKVLLRQMENLKLGINESLAINAYYDRMQLNARGYSEKEHQQIEELRQLAIDEISTKNQKKDATQAELEERLNTLKL